MYDTIQSKEIITAQRSLVMRKLICLACSLTLLLLCTSCSKSSDGWVAVSGITSGGIINSSEKPSESYSDAEWKSGTAVFTMTDYADYTTALSNPDKGWYIHYYDNTIKRYGAGLTPEEALKYIPCLDHIYLRLAWSYLEPQEGKFNWEIIDSVIEPYTQAGIGISFRITCKETDTTIPYATPEWVKNAGAAGTEIGGVWEPDYGDPIFLEKLDNFHRAFAKRYAGKDYIRYIDVGSYGDWGEGHTASSSKKDWPWSDLKKHFDIYAKYYPNDLIVVSDDFIGSRRTSEGKQEILNYVLSKGWTFRDDSISVDWFAKSIGGDTVRSPELFASVWKTKPVVLELEHYNKTLQYDNWNNGSTFYDAAVNTHCTYAGFHGYVNEWIRDNADFAVKMGNKLGYWYFIDSAELQKSDGAIDFTVNWRNEGMSRAYNKYDLDIIFTDETGADTVFAAQDFDNTKFMPGEKAKTRHTVKTDELKSGKYTVSLRMKKGDRAVLLAVDKAHTGPDGRCILGSLEI